MASYAPSASASSSSIAAWNSRMSAASSLTVAISWAISAAAPSIAAFSAAASPAGSPVAVRLATADVSTVTGPMARPGEAARPVRWISATASDLAETVMHQRQHGREGRLTIGTGNAKMQRRALRRFHAHNLHGAFGIRPGSVRHQGEFDLRSTTLRALRELDRWPG